MTYALVRPLLFAMKPETAHACTLSTLSALNAVGLIGLATGKVVDCPRSIMGITFPNPVGLAAGLDKNGDHIDPLAALGFGFIEIGTVTPRPQPGNPQPRLFRLPSAGALINRMGFNNAGVDHLVRSVARSHYRGVLGINIGKNFDTPVERAGDDYAACLRKVYVIASYITVNISSPNTRNLRDLQHAQALAPLLSTIKQEQSRLADLHGKYVPIAIKIAPDLDAEQINAIAALLIEHRIDAVIATNTTIARDAVANCMYGQETGGLSGNPLTAMSRAVVHALKSALNNAVPIIGVGGIMNGDNARDMIAAGASLVQLYTGLIYRGPVLVKEAVHAACAIERISHG